MTDDQHPGRWRRAWPTLKRVLSALFVLAMVALVVVMARKLDWQEVGNTLTQYSARTFWLAGGATLLSYVVYCLFDVLGKHYVGHHLPVRQVVPVAFVCYAFNLNLSAWVGGVALRYRLYARLGLRTSQITRIFTFSILSNWLSYMALAGVVFALGWVTPPPDWELGAHALRLVGVGLILFILFYLGLCAFSRRRAWSVRGHEVLLPSLRMALIQLVVGSLNWALMGLAVYYMLFEKVSFTEVLGILLISAVAGILAHIPAGLGVTEAVFVALLTGEMSKASVVAGLIGYRVVYFLAPLLLAIVLYFVLESRARHLRKRHGGPPSADTPARQRAPGR